MELASQIIFESGPRRSVVNLAEHLSIKEIYDYAKEDGCNCIVTMSKGVARVNYVERRKCPFARQLQLR